ncbi:hypothetical protein WA158_005307 [Blastocystis sp. Blastoise]
MFITQFCRYHTLRQIRVETQLKSQNDKYTNTHQPNSEPYIEPTFIDPGKKYFKLSSRKFASVNYFKGVIYVDIRQYDVENNKYIPTKKGISLTLDQWELIKNMVNTIQPCIDDMKNSQHDKQRINYKNDDETTYFY